MKNEEIAEKARQVWEKVKEHPDVFFAGASLGLLLGAIL